MGKLKKYDLLTDTWLTIATGSGGSSGGGSGTFLGLTDTPLAFTGQAGKVAAVNIGETALEFIPGGGGGAGLTTGYRAHPSATITLPTRTTARVPMDTVDFDINSEHDLTSGRWVCGADGVYLLIGQLHYAPGTTGYRAVYFYKNATTTGTPEVYDVGSGTLLGVGYLGDANGEEVPSGISTAQLTIGDYIDVFARHSQGSDVVVGDASQMSSWLSVIRIA